MSELEVKPANIKKEDGEGSEYKSVLEKSPKQKTTTEEVEKEVTMKDEIKEEFLLDEDIDEEEFKVKVEKIKNKETLIQIINDVVDLHIENNENPAIDYKFGILIEHFKELFGTEECDKCFEDTIEKIREYNELRDISKDNTSVKPKKPSRFKNWRNKRKLKKQSKDVELANQDFVLYQGQEKKLNKTKKAQAKGKGNWRKVLKYGVAVFGSILVSALTLILPIVGTATIIATTIGLIYRDAKKKSKYRKQISNKVGGTIDKLEDAHDKSNMKKMEDELNKFKKEDPQPKFSSDKPQKDKKDGSKDDELQNQQNQMINQNQQNPMMQNQMAGQNGQNPMMQNQMAGQNGQNPMMQNQTMGQVNNQYNPWGQYNPWNPFNQYNPYQQNYPVDPYTQQYQQMWQQMMQNPMMQQMMGSFQQVGTQGQQMAQTQPAGQQNVTQQQPAQTFQQKIQQQNTNAQQNSTIGIPS